MSTVGELICSIPLEELTSAEDMALESLHMDRERAMKRFSEQIESTLAACMSTYEGKGVFKGFRIEGIEGDEIRLEGGVVLKSAVLPEMLQGADEVVMYTAVVHGYEELAQNPENSMVEGMFFDAWGVGFSRDAHLWIKREIARRAAEDGRYAGRGWTPGEEDLEMSLQKVLFECIDPSQIGVTLLENGSMRPVMTVSGFMGLSTDPAIEQVGADKLESH